MTAGVPVWDSGLARPTAHEPGWATTPRHAIAAEGVTAIRSWVAAIRLQEAVTGLSGRLPRRSGEPIRRSCGIQLAVLPPWVPGVPVAALVSWGARWSLQSPHVLPAFGSWTTPIIVLTANPMMPGRTAPDRGTGH